MRSGNRLIEGVDKHDDPSTSIFGSYSGSGKCDFWPYSRIVSDNACKITDQLRFWRSARKIKRDIQKINFSSIARLKLNNYIYRRKRLFNYFKRTVDVSKYTRMFSVEVANLGAWGCFSLC